MARVIDQEDMGDLSKRIRIVMQEQNIPLNSKTLSVNAPNEVLEAIMPMLSDLGSIDRTDMQVNRLLITYSKVAEAFLAREALDGLLIGEIKVTANWEPIANKLKASLYTPIPEVFMGSSLCSSGIPLPPSTPLKYTATFPISVPNDTIFCAKARVLGARGCNFYRIVDTCSKKLVFEPERASEVIKLRIVEEPEFAIKINSRFLDLLQIASKLTSELLSALYDEYKRFCEIAEIVPPDLTVMNFQRVKGRLQALRAGLGTLANCMATSPSVLSTS